MVSVSMKRRQLGVVMGTVGVSLVAGSAGDTDDGALESQAGSEGGNADGQRNAAESVVEQWVAAADDSAIETANSYAVDDERSDYRFSGQEEFDQQSVELESAEEIGVRDTIRAIDGNPPTGAQLEDATAEWDALLSEFATEELDGEDWTIVRTEFTGSGEQDIQHILLIDDGQAWLL